ncbi:sulfurtransferase [Rubrobacter indicoceani]|uniref:sulfurtransferase n=1 Tax=Rubrobacter indicoceani TaxID=2051957 RepID=UPI000E5BFB8C|nr:sulfurtransferase [Rubrobacter indicoceani]
MNGPKNAGSPDGVTDFDPLATTDWLAANLDRPDLRIVDIRGYVRKTDLGEGRQGAEYVAAREEYDEAHIPGAVFVDWTRDITDPDDPVPAQVAPPERFKELMGSLGIGDGSHIVVYDHAGGQFATRLWWAMMYYGHEHTSVLDGGWTRWREEGRPATDETPEPEPATFTPKTRPGWRSDANEMLAASRSGSRTILDARDAGQYTGEVTRGEGRPGHVPGAKHLHADALFAPGGGILSGAEAEARLREAGVPEDRESPVVAYCNGGVAATVTLFAMYRLGYRNLSNYDGSWNEWGVREDLPTG